MTDLQNYITEIVRLPKQAKDDEIYKRHIDSIKLEISKFGKNGKIDLPAFLKLMQGNIMEESKIDYFLTDDELYTMTCKRFFKYCSKSVSEELAEDKK